MQATAANRNIETIGYYQVLPDTMRMEGCNLVGDKAGPHTKTMHAGTLDEIVSFLDGLIIGTSMVPLVSRYEKPSVSRVRKITKDSESRLSASYYR